MPAINDHGSRVSIVEDFCNLDAWIAPSAADFRKVMGTRVLNEKALDLSGIHGYIPDTFNDFEVKNIRRSDNANEVSQMVKGPWENTKLQTAMEQLKLELNTDDPDNPYLFDDDIRVESDSGVELAFTGRWFIRGWKIDLVVKKNKNGIKEVEFFRDEIRWVKVPDGEQKADEDLEVFTSAYWVPY